MNKYTIVMGEYPQNCGLEKEPIEWIVLKEEEHRCLCISKYLIDCKQYHNLSEKITVVGGCVIMVKKTRRQKENMTLSVA